jgi:hypothetical protein
MVLFDRDNDDPDAANAVGFGTAYLYESLLLTLRADLLARSPDQDATL